MTKTNKTPIITAKEIKDFLSEKILNLQARSLIKTAFEKICDRGESDNEYDDDFVLYLYQVDDFYRVENFDGFSNEDLHHTCEMIAWLKEQAGLKFDDENLLDNHVIHQVIDVVVA